MEVLLKYALFVFKLLGYWPLKIKNSKMLLIYNIYCYVTITILIITTWSLWWKIPNAARGDMRKFVNNISICVQFTYSCIKLLCFSLSVMKGLFQKVKVTENNILKSSNVDVKAIYIKYSKMVSKVGLYCYALGCANAGMYLLSPSITNLTDPSSDELSLPLDCYFPFDSQKYYKIAFGLVAIEGTVVTSYLAASNLTFVGLMAFITSQLHILKYEIKEGVDTTRFTQEEIQKKLKKIAMYYQNILK